MVSNSGLTTALVGKREGEWWLLRGEWVVFRRDEWAPGEIDGRCDHSWQFAGVWCWLLELLFCDKSQSSLAVRLSSGEGAYDSWVPFGRLQVNESSEFTSPCIWCFPVACSSNQPEWHILGQYVLNSSSHIFYYPSCSVQSFCLFLFSLPFPYGELWELQWASS